MKRYRLRKDTPTIKAGTIFEEVVSDFDGAKELARITPVGAKTNPQWTIRDIDNFDEWFEEVKEPTDSIHWKPRIGGRCFILENANIRQHFSLECYVITMLGVLAKYFAPKKSAKKPSTVN